jgi:hypothetical protein
MLLTRWCITHPAALAGITRKLWPCSDTVCHSKLLQIAGAAEACIDAVSLGGFTRLKALSTSYNDTPEKASRPFDKGRDGFVMGEGGAVLILEELHHAAARGAKVYAEVGRCCCCCCCCCWLVSAERAGLLMMRSC